MAVRTRPFVDRADAGRQLAERVVRLDLGDPGRTVVAALPRGGVPVAVPVAHALHAPLDVVVVRKVGLPWQPEVALGAVGEGGAHVLVPGVATQVDPTHVTRLTHAAAAEVARRVAGWRGPRPPADVAGRTVVVVDDGIATGATARAAVQVLRARGAGRVVLAVPIVDRAAAAALRHEVDALVAVVEAVRLGSVGAWYDDFAQVDDEVVRGLLAPG